MAALNAFYIPAASCGTARMPLHLERKHAKAVNV
jgi:hypothetical protein